MDLAEKFGLGFGALMVVGVLSTIPAWATHIIWWVGKLASDTGATFGQVFLGIIGAFIPPVGVVHGYMLWFGYGWS